MSSSHAYGYQDENHEARALKNHEARAFCEQIEEGYKGCKARLLFSDVYQSSENVFSSRRVRCVLLGRGIPSFGIPCFFMDVVVRGTERLVLDAMVCALTLTLILNLTLILTLVRTLAHAHALSLTTFST